MSQPEITVENFTEAIRAAVAERGADFVYKPEAPWQECTYQNSEGEPDCLIGLALHKLGVKLYRQWDQENLTADQVLEQLEAPENLKRAALYAQQFQDEKFTWGEALTEYERVINND